MSKTWLFILLVVGIILLTTSALIGSGKGIIFLIAMVCALLVVWLYVSVIRQLRTVQNGLYLLQAQDFASRLSKVGNRDADRIVSLFNRLMQTLKEERLKKEEQDRFLRQLIEASPMGIAICSLDGVPVTTNPAYQNLTTDSLVSEIDSLQDGEVKTVRAKGSEVFRISRLSFMERGFRRPFILIERLTDEILSVEKQTYSKVIRTMAHEVNNTLGSITSVFETLLESESDETVSRTLEICHARCLSLRDFVKNYAKIAKVPAPVLKPVDLKDEVERLLPFFKEMAAGVADVRIDGVSETVYADSGLLEQVFTNIVKNAVEAIAEADVPDGQIVISLDAKSIRFINNGREIPGEASDKLFTPFYTTKPDGQGLGLILVADILRNHHADFSLSSANGQTVFAITFQ